MPTIERLTHTGLYVRDIERSRAFYKDVLGLVETDYDRNANLLFLSADPQDEHHMVVLIGGRTAPLDTKLLQQVAFRCRTLADVLAFWRRFVEQQVKIIYTITHGNAVSCYFRDPDENVLEVYWPTGLDAKQGFLVDLDFSQSESDLMTTVRAAVERHGVAGFVDMTLLERQL